MDRLVRAFPVLDKEAFLAFTAEVGRRQEEATAFYRSYGVVRESWHLQDGPGGPIVIACTDLEDVKDAAPAYAAATGAFDSWFKQRVKELTGVDPATTPRGPACDCIFDWPDAVRGRS